MRTSGVLATRTGTSGGASRWSPAGRCPTPCWADRASAIATASWGNGRDDDLIEAPRIDAVVDGHDGIGVADDSLDIGPAASLSRGRACLITAPAFARSLILGVDDPMQANGPEFGTSSVNVAGPRSARSRTASKQRLGGGGLVSHHQHSNGGLGGLHVRTPFSVIACDDRTLWLMPQDAAFHGPITRRAGAVQHGPG